MWPLAGFRASPVGMIGERCSHNVYVGCKSVQILNKIISSTINPIMPKAYLVPLTLNLWIKCSGCSLFGLVYWPVLWVQSVSTANVLAIKSHHLLFSQWCQIYDLYPWHKTCGSSALVTHSLGLSVCQSYEFNINRVVGQNWLTYLQ